MVELVGSRWIRQDFAWDIIENKPGEWNFRHWDGYVDRAEAWQRKVLAILDYDVSWIHEANRSRPYIPPDQLSRFLSYVEKVATRY